MTAVRALTELTSPELAPGPGGDRPTLVVPIGSIEQHGPHLPLDTDTRVAALVSRRAAERFDGAGTVVLGPPLPYGASGEHEGFPGTVSIGREALELVLLELGRSASRWAGRILLVNGHGGNAVPVAAAVHRLRYEGRDAAWLPCTFPAADAHAGRTETSVLLAHDPAAVRLDRAEPGNTAPIGEVMDRLRAGGVAAVAPNGILGDPTAATAADGARMLDALTATLVAALQRWAVDDTGRLT